MNLHAIAAPYIHMVNPLQAITVRISDGYTTADDGTRTPLYAADYTARAQIQAMSSRDLRQVEGLNLQGTLSAIYLLGDIEGGVRLAVKGGDILVFPNGDIYLVVIALENWGASYSPAEQWSKVAAQLQNGS